MSEVNTTVSKLVSRSDMRSFMNVAAKGAEEKYEQMGEGFTSLSESKNAKEYSRQYVHERTERTSVVGYAPSVAYSVDVHTNNPVIKRVVDVTKKELVGTDAEVDIVTADLYEGEGTTHPATKRTYSIIPDSIGDGNDALVVSGNFRAVGDIIEGTFDTSTNTFTAATKELAANGKTQVAPVPNATAGATK